MVLPIVVALAALPPAPAPAPNASAKPTPLTEIGRVRALPACVPIVAHANGAITQALDNDRTLGILTNNLHATDFDKLNSLQRRNAIEALMKQAEQIRVASSAGDAEIKKLREYAVNSPDPQRKEELKAFADALGGALYRQKKAAVEFMRDVTIMRGREDAAEAHGLMQQANPVPPFAVAQQMANLPPPLPVPPPTYNKQMQMMGDALLDMTQGVLSDEGTAADHSIAATSGC
ncbi:MAG: hypothetical protein JO164_09840 [Candidatus Eremiobacteraeota bacterium]|nr:hypothetical protein [Candidatus Eremiobacteraeota bacterium]